MIKRLLCVWVLASLFATPALAAEEAIQNELPCRAVDHSVPANERVAPPRFLASEGKSAGIVEDPGEIDAEIANRLAQKPDSRFLIARGTITKEGRLTDVEILCSQPSGVDVEWLAAMSKHWRFRPAKKRSEPTSFRNWIFGVSLETPQVDPRTCLVKDEERPFFWSSSKVRPLYVGADPRYPPAALDAGTEGLVVVSVIVAPTGELTNPVVKCATQPGMFEQSALTAIRTWLYYPLTVNGRAIEHDERYIEVEFRIR
jgi:protein TonB